MAASTSHASVEDGEHSRTPMPWAEREQWDDRTMAAYSSWIAVRRIVGPHKRRSTQTEAPGLFCQGRVQPNLGDRLVLELVMRQERGLGLRPPPAINSETAALDVRRPA